MSTTFDLVIAADPSGRSAELRLQDADGRQLAWRQADFSAIAASRMEGLFDLRNYLRTYVEAGGEAAAFAEIGVVIARQLMGTEIFDLLNRSESQRTLRILLPATGGDEVFAAALARVPWEIARGDAGSASLSDRNLLVRVVPDQPAPPSSPLSLGADEPLRVLFVFAESRGSRPLGGRKERLALQRLFEREIYPQRRIVAHFLSHGVTRERLETQIQENGGYHVVHWSGHGHLNRLELSKPGGAGDSLTGAQVLGLFNDAGGFLPRFFFLSACQSGDSLKVSDWSDFLAMAQGKEPAQKRLAATGPAVAAGSGDTGTAHALLRGGVPAIVAMRYSVGDDYARELAVEFYRALFAHAQPKNIAAALTLARRALQDPDKHDRSRFSVCDDATPLLYGEVQPGLTLAKGISPAQNARNPRLHQIAELTTGGHAHFVGRTWELAGMGAGFIGSSTGAEVKPVAVIAGLGGMGKTALTAEALALWESRFDSVLLYQAKPAALALDATLRDIHVRLMGELGRYHDHVRSHPADAIHREPGTDFTGPERIDRLIRNLVRACRDQPLLLVLDNFETHLKADPVPDAGGRAAWACQDPAWDRLLATLAADLAGSPSRVLVTCRRPLAALAKGVGHAVPLGPLSSADAALYLREHPVLSAMALGNDAAERQVAIRLLNATRFHPLLMDRLTRLAGEPTQRRQLLQALDAMEQTHDFAQLPALFAVDAGNDKEMAYLDDVLATSLDQLVAGAGADARRLLWIVSLGNEPVMPAMLEELWRSQFAPGDGASAAAEVPMAPLLAHLLAVGLATQADATAGSTIASHELVRERTRAWMAAHPQDLGGLGEERVRTGYGERMRAIFARLQHVDTSVALAAGRNAIVYFVQARQWDRLDSFTGRLVTSRGDPRLLSQLIPHLRTAAASAPEGFVKVSCLGSLADALRSIGQVEESLPLYEQATAAARLLALRGGADAHRAWDQVAVLSGNWGNSLFMIGRLDEGSAKHRESAEAEREAGNPEVNILSSEIEALRIQVLKGEAEAASPEIEPRVEQILGWWTRRLAGETVAEAPDLEFLARAVVSALDVSKMAFIDREDWAPALRRLDQTLLVENHMQRAVHDIAMTRHNRATVLMELEGRLGEAKTELEHCLEVFEDDLASKAMALGSLSNLLTRQSDFAQALVFRRRALALREQLPDVAARASSHQNLAIDLGNLAGGHPAPAEATRHQLAALAYRIVARLERPLKDSLRKYAVDMRRADAVGAGIAVPRVAELVANPAFSRLQAWLASQEVGVEALQSRVDELLALVREKVAKA